MQRSVVDRRRDAVFLVLCAALAACGRGSAQRTGPGQAQETDAPVEVRVAVAERRTQTVTLTLDGTLLADEESRVTPVVAGRVLEVFVERGALVERGAPLVRLRDVDYRLQAAAARAQLDQARARLGLEQGEPLPDVEALPDVRAARAAMELAEANLRRAEELAARGVLAPQALDEARQRATQAREQYATARNAARASIAALSSARTALAQASTAATEATVRAPFSGEIAERLVSVGEYVSPQTPLVTLVRTDPLRIEVIVPQRHLLAVRPGQTVRVSVDAVPGRTFEGTVRYVSAQVDRQSRGLVVEAVVPNPDRLLRPGLYATARIDTGATQEVAIVPAAAVQTRAGVDRVLVVQGDRVQERVVTVAERGDVIAIEEGVSAGERVVLDGHDRLADGMRVTIADEAAAAAPPAEGR